MRQVPENILENVSKRNVRNGTAECTKPYMRSVYAEIHCTLYKSNYKRNSRMVVDHPLSVPLIYESDCFQNSYNSFSKYCVVSTKLYITGTRIKCIQCT